MADKRYKDMNPEEQRAWMRDYQAKRRGGRSYLAERDAEKLRADRLEVCLAWEAGEISEGTAAKLLGMDRVTARGFKLDAIARGMGYESDEDRMGSQKPILRSVG